MYLKKVLYCGLYNPQCKRYRKIQLWVVQSAIYLFFDCIAVCTTRNVFKKKLYCGLYNPQCI